MTSRHKIPVIALVLSVLVGASLRADLFWVGGSGLWGDPFSWSGTLGGQSGAGPPNISTDTRFEGIGTPFTVSLTSNRTGGDVELRLDSVDTTFDLGGNTLTLHRDFFAESTNSQVNNVTIGSGTLDARALTARTFGTGQLKMIVEPTTHVSLRETLIGSPPAFASQLTALGFGAQIIVQGSVFMDDTAFAVIDLGGEVQVDDGTLDIFDRLEIDRLGELKVVNNGAASVHGTFDIGIDGAADVTLSTNAALFTFGPVVMGTTSVATGNVSLQDAGTRWEARDPVTLGGAGTGNVHVDDGALLSVLDAGAHTMLAAGPTGAGQLTVGGLTGATARFESQSSVFVGGTSMAAGGSGELLVNPTGITTIEGLLKVWGQGRVEADGGSITTGQLVVTSGGRLSIDHGGSIEATTVELQNGANLSGFDDGSLIIRGPGATLSAPTSSFGFGSDSGLPTIHLDNATSFVTDWTIANFPGASGKTVVSGQSARLHASNDLRVTGPNTQTNGFLEIRDGGLADAGDDITIAFASTSTGQVVVDGIAANGRRSILRNNAQGQDSEIEIGRNGQATLDVLNGALVQSLNNISIASFPSAEGSVNVTGGGGALSQMTASNDLAVGGFATIDAAGGTGMLAINNLGHVRVDDRMKVYASGTIDMSPGGLLETNRLHVCGQVENAGVINVGGSSLPASDGSLVVGSAGELVLDGGTLRTESFSVEEGATVDLIDGTLLIEGGSFSNGLTSFVFGSPTGLPTVELASGGEAEVTFAWKIGTAAGFAGRTVLRDPGTRLANTGGGGGADLVVGSFGSGALEIFDGAVADFNDDLVVADQPGSDGTVFVRGVAAGQRATVVAAGSSNNDIFVGRNGLGSLDIVDGALVNSADDVIVGFGDLAPGADGFITVSGAQGGFNATLQAADDLAIGVVGINFVDHGHGVVVVHEGGEVNIGDATLVGSDDALAVIGGTLRTGRLLLENDPTRLQWTGGTVALTASGLTLQTGGTLGRVVTLDDDMTLSVHGTRRIAQAGVLLLDGGRFEGNDEVIIDQGGFLGGSGIVSTPVFAENSGRLAPDGLLQIEGHYVQESSGELVVGIGPSFGSGSMLLVTQTAQLGGTMEILAGSTVDPDIPGTAESYTLISASTLQDSFDTVIYDVTDLTALATVAPDGSFLVYVGPNFNGVEGLFRGLDYSSASGELILTNYLALPGDANGDMVVDGQDFIIWNDNKFQTGTDWLTADFNGDGVTDGQDFIVWNDHKFASVDALLAVPEPGLAVLSIAGLLVTCSFRRNKRTGTLITSRLK